MMLRARSSIQAFLLAISLVACDGIPLTVDGGQNGSGGVGGTGGGATGSGGAGGSKSDGGVCPAIACAPSCPAGAKTDPNGCPTCECNPGPVCGPVCDIFCQYGNVKDASGCPLCKCNPPPNPPAACDTTSCPQPAPGAPNHLCPDGKTVGGPACVALASGACGWVFITCPPKCVQNEACVVGAHWDPDLCKCVLPCDCPAGEICVEQIGGPAVQNPPPMTCQPYDSACYQASGNACACLPKTEGHCKPRGGDRACVCDNGIR